MGREGDHLLEGRALGPAHRLRRQGPPPKAIRSAFASGCHFVGSAPWLAASAFPAYAANLYDTIDSGDDANHFVNWSDPRCGVRPTPPAAARRALGGLRARLRIRLRTAVLWGARGVLTFIPNSPELRTAYTDRLGDLASGLAGSTLAALVTVTLLWPSKSHASATPA